MRSLFLTCVLSAAACSGYHPAAPQSFDPELADACGPMIVPPADAPCTKDLEGRVIPRTDDPATARIREIQGLSGEEDADSAQRIVELSTAIIDAEATSVCARQVALWHRAAANSALERWVPSFQDYGSAIKDGPRSPFFTAAGPKIEGLAPHLPDYAVASCHEEYRRIAAR
jgi:hypothetical protein